MIAGRTLLLVALAAGCAAASGCGLFGSKPPEPPKPLVYSLCLDASPKLNWYNDTANTLYVRAYQLSTADTFMQTDPARMVEPGFTLSGAEGAPVEKTIFPVPRPASTSASNPTPPRSVSSPSTTTPRDR